MIAIVGVLYSLLLLSPLVGQCFWPLNEINRIDKHRKTYDLCKRIYHQITINLN